MTDRGLLLLALLGITQALPAQEQARTRLSVLVGGSVLYGGGNPWMSGDNDFMLSSSDTLVSSSGMDNIGHVGLGVSRALSNTALVLRGEVLFNQNRASPWHAAISPFPGSPNMRQALRERTLLGGAGLQWDALPRHRMSPYLLTSAGVRASWIGWSRDSSRTSPDRTVRQIGPFVSLGGGLRLKLGRREYFTEWRWYGLPNDLAGSRFVPVSVGMRF
jgi:hypothetical protein